MPAKDFDLNLLKVLDALLAERNVTRAGKRLGRSLNRPSATRCTVSEHCWTMTSWCVVPMDSH